jgi:hypothetical protein
MALEKALAVLFATLVAAAAPAPAPAAPPSAEPLAMSVNYWGKPLMDVAVSAGGDVVETYTREVPGGKLGDYDLVTKRFRLDPADLATVRDLLAPARPWVGRSLPCPDPYSDLPYGSIRFGADELGYNGGCHSKEAIAVQQGLAAAIKLIDRRSEAAPVAAVKEVREPAR